MSSKRFLFSALTLALSLFLAMPAAAQSLTSGDITGVLTDPSGAVVGNATVTVKSNATGNTQTQNTNAQGAYRFSLLSPGNYTVSVNAKSFPSAQRQTVVSIGQASPLSVQLTLGTAEQIVEVTGEGSTVQSENANLSTTFTPEQIALVPNPGNDLSYVLQTAPGVVMNTQMGYGNGSTYGLPATSNLFTVNGMNENDPFFNLNNSGATNLLLGQNDVNEATVVNNGYSGQYGGLAGANVNYVTKAGSHSYHGNAIYWWNGSAMNANNYFNNQSGTPRPFDNANQWAASFGGPIKKDKTFFFVDYEGLRVILPTRVNVNIPSSQFQTAPLADLTANSPASVPFYNQLFSLYNNAAGASRAVPFGSDSGDPTGCAGFTDTASGLGITQPCALHFQSTAGNLTTEWLVTGRLDQNLGNNDRLFAHFRTDHGLQASYTAPISPVFNAVSNQPQYEGQLQETH